MADLDTEAQLVTVHEELRALARMFMKQQSTLIQIQNTMYGQNAALSEKLEQIQSQLPCGGGAHVDDASTKGKRQVSLNKQVQAMKDHNNKEKAIDLAASSETELQKLQGQLATILRSQMTEHAKRLAPC